LIPPGGGSREWQYDAVGNVTNYKDATGVASQFSYDASNRLTLRTDALGGKTTWVYLLGLLDSVKDELNRTTSYSRDDAGQLTRVTRPDPDGSGPLSASATQFDYDLAGQINKVTDARGASVSLAYDLASQLIQTTAPDPDGASGPLAAAVTSYTFDAAGRHTGTTDPLGHATSFGFDAADRLTSITRPDPDGTGPLSASVSTFGYDLAGRQVSTTDPEGSVTISTRDKLGQVTHITMADPDGTGPLAASVTQLLYDAGGLLAREIDPNGNATDYIYNAKRQLIEERQTDDGIRLLQTLFFYDLEGRPLGLRDPAWNQTQYDRDALGRVIRELDPLGRQTAYVFDAASQLTRITDRLGRVREFDYDAAGRGTAEKWKSSASATVPSRTISYTYDETDRLTAVSDDSAANGPGSDSGYLMGYDNASRLVTMDNAGTPLVPRVQLTYSYDTAGRRTRVDNSMPGSAGAGLPAAATAGFISYTHDAADRLTRIEDGTLVVPPSGGSPTDAVNKRVDFAYNKRDQVTEIQRLMIEASFASLVTTASLSYDAMGRLVDLLHSGPPPSALSSPPLLDRFQLSYDPGSRITSVTTTPTGANLSAFTTTYAYDKTDQLTAVTSTLRNESFAFDPAGNRTTSAVGTDNRTYTMAALPHANRLSRDGQYEYAFDFEGNLIRKSKRIGTTGSNYNGETWFYTWDHRNRLVSSVKRATSSATSTCAINAYGSSRHGFAALWHPVTLSVVVALTRL